MIFLFHIFLHIWSKTHKKKKHFVHNKLEIFGTY